MLYFLGGNLQSERFAPAFAHVVEARERVKRKRIPVEVIFQIKDARKTCAGKFRFIHEPSSFWFSVSHAAARSEAGLFGPTVASRPINAHAVCDAVVLPLPLSAGS